MCIEELRSKVEREQDILMHCFGVRLPLTSRPHTPTTIKPMGVRGRRARMNENEWCIRTTTSSLWSYYSYNGPSQVQQPICQERRLSLARLSLYSYHLMVQLTTGEPRDPLCLQLYMEDIAYRQQKDDVRAISNAYTLPSTDINTRPHYAGKGIKDNSSWPMKRPYVSTIMAHKTEWKRAYDIHIALAGTLMT